MNSVLILRIVPPDSVVQEGWDFSCGVDKTSVVQLCNTLDANMSFSYYFWQLEHAEVCHSVHEEVKGGG
jgi:hypothetical protein